MAGFVDLLWGRDNDLGAVLRLDRVRGLYGLLVSEVVRPLVAVPPLLAPGAVVIPAGRRLLRHRSHRGILTVPADIR